MGNFLSLDFFHIVKPLMSILPLLPILSIYEKLDCLSSSLFSVTLILDFTGFYLVNESSLVHAEVFMFLPNSLTEIFVIRVEGLEPATSCVRDQDAITVHARHMLEF